ncbi:MAG TPA: carbohydrate porin [Phycisphaerae bacterium]|nr:carbohydrate porin [Phycisphaerae bacterium]HRR85097.1 carbohydrate porin [Phycisphaerae bacterium]
MARTLLASLVVLFVVPMVIAQPTTAPAGYGGSWTEWSKATGDWGGARTALADKGITLDWGITQIVQENMHGGADTNSAIKYSGSSSLELKLDTGKMGLWPGGTFVFHGEPRWGRGINRFVGSLMPANMDALMPGGDDSCEMTLSEFFYQQVLFEGKLVLLAGKLDGSRAFDTNMFANNEETQFMNVALRNYPMIPQFIPYTTLGIGIVFNPFEWWSIRTAVVDSDGSATRTGFDTAFHGDANTSVMHEWDFTVKPFGQLGHQRVAMITSCKDTPTYTGGMQNCNLAVLYNFDQYLWTESEGSDQGVGIFGRFGWADKDVNPVEYFYSLGVSAKGLIPTRDRDTCGLGWYFGNASNQLAPAGIVQESGIEMYYSIEVFPWLHISPDFQIICNPGGGNADTALVGGVRFQMDL